MSAATKPIDTSVRVPAAVAAAAARAEAAQRRYIGEPEPPAAAEPTPQPEPQPEPAPPAAAEPTPQPEPQPEPAPQPNAEIIPPAPSGGEDWKEKYERQQGRLVALEKREQGWRDRIDGLERVIATMQMEPAPASDPTSEQTKFVTDDDVSTFGSEFFDAVEKKAKELIAPLEAKLNARLTQLGTQVGGVAEVVKKDAQATMEEKIAREVPNWLQLNQDQEFISWCSEEDPLTGQVRLDMLMNAWERKDGTRVANFFKAYLREKEVVTSDEPPANGGREPAPTVSLGAFAAPGKARTAPAPKDAPAKQPITRKFIAEFYADVRTGKYRNDPAKQAEIERDIFAAQQEGRITS